MNQHLIKRSGVYYYQRRVPQEVADIDPRRMVRISLKTKDPQMAARRADITNQYMEQYWSSLVATGATDSEKQYKQAVSIARAHGFTYRTAAEISTLPLGHIVDRVLAAQNQPARIATAILGAVEEPQLMLHAAIERYWPLCFDRLMKKSERQQKRWKTPRLDAFRNFIAITPDKPIHQINNKDILAFKDWWAKKIQAEDLSTDTANKQIRTIHDILRTVAMGAGIEVNYAPMFLRIAFKPQKNQRQPFEADYVQKVFLNSDALSGLNDDARYIVYATADTGARLSELVALKPGDIFLDAEIPYIWIRGEKKRELKTHVSDRQIPLVGSALYAFQCMPNGFDRYENADSASAAINKFLRENKLVPSQDHTLYSLRHTFKDRLRDAGAPEEVIDNLMGHENNRPKYGRGHNLETKKKWLNRIAFTISSHPDKR